MFGLLLIAAHMVGDFLLQADWMAARKLIDWRVRAVHVTVYTAVFVPLVWLAKLPPGQAGQFLALLWITHFITDCRRWASGEKWPPKPILVDQTIHVATLAVLAFLFGFK